MFTLDQIKAAHAQVKSGADFPQYIRDLKAMGVAGYDTFVLDGHAVFVGKDDYSVSSEAKYPPVHISPESNADQFAQYLKSHQQGQTDYLRFCGHAAESGVHKWTVDIAAMTCTYFDTRGNLMLSEPIPS
ncbi:DUF1398 domain-containing protein [Flavobacterium sp.]|uniref:DUF1398 domain-containing protein n=1 Tax=Flavobacterium sp. TaxID=239 RepID=UPI0039E4AE14